MRAVVLRSYGPASNLEYSTVPDPVAGSGQVRIAVRAAGVHAVETMMREGLIRPTLPPPPQLPAILGREVAGIVESVGPGVADSWIGQHVVTSGGHSGGYAELAVADLAAVHRISAGLEFGAAVAMVVTGTTALQLLDVAQLTSADIVLVTSAAGGIGQLVVQYARDLGATVIGAAGGPEKVATVQELGADLAVDYNLPSWEEIVASKLGGRVVTAVLDGVGGDKARAAFSLIGDGGRYVTIGNVSQEAFEPHPDVVKAKGITVIDALGVLLARPEENPKFEVLALKAAEEGRLVPAVQAFPLDQAAAAHTALAARATTGKVVLIP